MEQYAKYKDSGIEWAGEIPSEWSCCQISYLSSCSNGATPSRDVPEYWNGDIPWMSSGEVNQEIVLDTKEKITFAGLRNSSTHLLPVHTVMIALNGQGKTKGTSTVLGIEVCSNQSLAGFICDEKRLHYRWLNLCFKSMYGYLRGESGQAQRDGIAASALKHERIPVPDIATQRVISDYIDTKTAEIDSLIADAERSVKLLEEYRKSVISEVVTKGLEPNVPMKDSGIEWIGKMPEHWQSVQLGMICATRNGLDYDSSNICSPTDGNATLVLRSGNIRNGKFDFDDCAYINKDVPDELRLREGDVVIVRTNGSRELVGKSAVVAEGVVGTLGAFMLLCRSEYGRYICWLFQSTMLSYYMGAFSTSTVNQLSNGTLKSLHVPFPPLCEQEKLCSYLDERTAAIDSLIDGKRSLIEKMVEYRKSLILEAVTGKLKVPGVE